MAVMEYYNINIYNRQSWAIMKHHVYRSVRNIGGGNFGRVDLVESETDGKYYVMKKLKLTESNKQTILKQVKIMRNLCHQYVIRYHESYIDHHDNVCIIMEYAENGQLQRYLNRRKTNNNPLTQDEVLEWFIQLCHGLKYVHDQRILHRDFKCENIFITAQNQLKIGDFGISKNMNATFQMAQTKIGTPCVMAPEIWENKMYNQKSDIWSLGCVLYKLMTLNHAFESKSTPAYVIKITAGTYPPITGNYSQELKDLVSAMLSLQPHNRPSVHSILQLDFIRKKVNDVLEGTLKKYEQSIQPPVLNKQKSNLSGHRLLSQKRSFSSLSNSSMLTPKSTTLNNTKIVELKQSYPVLVQEVNKLKQKVEEDEKKKENFSKQSKEIIEDVLCKLDQGKVVEIRRALDKLSYKIEQLIQA